MVIVLIRQNYHWLIDSIDSSYGHV